MLFFPIFSDVTCNNSTIIRPVSMKFALAVSNDKKHIFTPPTKTTHEGNFFWACE